MRTALLAALALVVQMSTVSAQKQTVTAKTAEKVDFAKFKTYHGFGGHTAYDPTIHKLIVDATRAPAARGSTAACPDRTPSGTAAGSR